MKKLIILLVSISLMLSLIGCEQYVCELEHFPQSNECELEHISNEILNYRESELTLENWDRFLQASYQKQGDGYIVKFEPLFNDVEFIYVTIKAKLMSTINWINLDADGHGNNFYTSTSGGLSVSVIYIEGNVKIPLESDALKPTKLK